MTTIDANTLKALGLTGNTAVAAANRNKLGQDQFLKLMTAQLNNQNPLKPQDNTEFLTQMAQFSTVSGIQDLQESFKSFSSTMQQDQAMTSSSLVGRSVSVTSNKAILPNNGTMLGSLDLPSGSTAVKLTISDANGKVVKTQNLGPQEAGSIPFEWDGSTDDGKLATPGTYQLQAEALIAGETTALATRAAAPVTSVTLNGAKGMEVELQGLGRYNVSDIQAVY